MTVATLITTPFTAESTAGEVVDGIDLTDRRAIVTGASSGIGIETGPGARRCWRRGDPGRPQRRRRKARCFGDRGTTGNTHVLVTPLDLADRASVASFVAAWTARCTSSSTTPE